jgi:hypothetical protein
MVFPLTNYLTGTRSRLTDNPDNVGLQTGNRLTDDPDNVGFETGNRFTDRWDYKGSLPEERQWGPAVGLVAGIPVIATGKNYGDVTIEELDNSGFKIFQVKITKEDIVIVIQMH